MKRTVLFPVVVVCTHHVTQIDNNDNGNYNDGTNDATEEQAGADLFHLDLQQLFRQAPLDRSAAQRLHLLLAEDEEDEEDDDASGQDLDDDDVQQYFEDLKEKVTNTLDALGRDGRVAFGVDASAESVADAAASLARLMLDAAVPVPLTGAPACGGAPE